MRSETHDRPRTEDQPLTGPRPATDAGDDTLDIDIIEDDECDGPRDEPSGLFTSDHAADFRSRWDLVQRGFVDDPAKAIRDGDALLSDLINELARNFAETHTAPEGRQAGRNVRGSAADGGTEAMRLTLRRRRALFEHLLAL